MQANYFNRHQSESGKLKMGLILLIMGVMVMGGISASNQLDEDGEYYQYCVVGAGPSGLQIAHDLHLAGRDYIVFEKGDRCGSFYRKYPIHRRLISINKRNTGSSNKEFNMRHDWNSLLSDSDALKMTKYSKLMFPDASVLVEYLNDFARHFRLNIRYNTTVADVTSVPPPRDRPTTTMFRMSDIQSDARFSCGNVIMATGIAKPNGVVFEGRNLTTSYEDLTLDLDQYEDKTVLVLGRGNTAFEVAQHIAPATSFVHMMARSPVRLAWATHYVGDVRAVNNEVLDTYQLKSLDGLFEGDISEQEFYRNENDGRIYFKEGTDEENEGWEFTSRRSGYDHVIRCLGWVFDTSPLRGSTTMAEAGGGVKYPLIGSDYQSGDHAGLYFTGTNTHSLDYRKSAGGFIHGFRYGARALHRMLEWRNHAVKWPSHLFSSRRDVISHVMKRMNEASDLWQMTSYMCDVIVHSPGDRHRYVESLPCARISEFGATTGHVTTSGDSLTAIALEYGKNFSGVGEDPFRADRAVSNSADVAHLSNFLHPVLYHYRSPDRIASPPPPGWTLPVPTNMLHLVEDFESQFDKPMTHEQRLRHFIDSVAGNDATDSRPLFASDCFRLAMTSSGPMPDFCRSGAPVIRRSSLLAPDDGAARHFSPLRDIKF